MFTCALYSETSFNQTFVFKDCFGLDRCLVYRHLKYISTDRKELSNVFGLGRFLEYIIVQLRQVSLFMKNSNKKVNTAINHNLIMKYPVH